MRAEYRFLAFAMATACFPLAAQEPSASQDVSQQSPQPYEATVPVPQSAPEPVPVGPPDETLKLEEVIVTARRTAENIQTVPVAVSTMSADDIQREQINSPQDLQGRVPSLVVGTNSQMRNTESPTVRGQGAQFGAAPGVAIYLGEVALPSDPVANYQGGPGKFFDLSDVQVLKGSQGTLFGRNTTGGALLLEPHKPEPGFSGSLRAGTSNFSGQTYEAVVNLPFFDDTLLSRIGGQIFKRDGFTEDVATGKDYDSKDYWTARVGLLWRPADAVDNYLLGYYSDSHDNGTATVIENINREGLNQAIPAAVGLDILSNLLPGLDLAQTANLGCLALDIFGPSTNCGQDILDEQHARGHRRVQLSGDPDDVLKSGSAIDQFNLHFSDEVTLRNIASYSTLRHHYRWDLDGSRAAFNEFINPDDLYETDVRTYSEELQLQGKALKNGLRYVVGGYYEHSHAMGNVVATSLFFVNTTQVYEQTKKSLAPFAQASFDLGNVLDPLAGLSVTLGGRYTRDQTSGIASIRQQAEGLITLLDKTHSAKVDDSALTYTAGLDYKLGKNLVYGKVSRGYKTGGMSVIVVNPAHYTYKPEFVTNYEVGQKSDFKIGGMPVRFNSAVYYTKYSDLQKAAADSYVDPNNPSPVPQLGQAVFNVGKAWVAGAEVDMRIQPFRGFTFIGSYGYTRGKYQEYTLLLGGATQQLDCSGQQRSRGEVAELSCLPFNTTPEHQYSVSARYLFPIDYSKGEVEASMTYAWTGEQYSAQTSLPEDEPGSWLPSYGLLNASLSWNRILGSHFDVLLFGTNLMDKEYRVSNSNQWHLTYIQSSIYSEPRIFGAQLAWRWGTY